ncbi:hypothetical protein P8A18_22260 [Streptomyces castrisilvae]|uniref:Integral membrane protein n=1 Tax=Streptomyces castrisilvae TaxID=3033811 RepID=A0ABY9HNU2_9ACTN|nr:hypothetical protein [Streptomyces sp. Mut1]WLQ35981.1 hypothetical protein P8A18_22260 [Streptomyces sp. Mut1]
MSGGSGWGGRGAGQGPAGARGGGSGGVFLPLALSWAAGAVVRLAVGYLVAHGLVRLLGTEARLDDFAWRLGLLHVPAVLATALTVLAAVRVLPEERRGSRALYLSAALAVPLVALCYGYATAWQVAGIEGAVMPVVAAATGAAVGLGVDRLLEEGEPDALAGSLTVK